MIAVQMGDIFYELEEIHDESETVAVETEDKMDEADDMAEE